MSRGILALVLLLGLPVAAQSPGAPVQMGPGSTSRFPAQGMPFDNPPMEGRRIQVLNALRQKSIVSDAEKLLRLARQLNADLSAPESNMSPAERMRAAAEIEKLAKSVKDKMTFAIGRPDETVPMGVWQ